ncbi:MAG: DUF7336 domain-containing protein [Candidatus Heimdallarchaeaceae archaeon]
MKKVYIVTSGEYSDYGIHAVFSKKELAEKFVELKNKIGYFGYTGAFIEEYDLYDSDMNFPNYPKDKNHYAVRLELQTGKTIFVSLTGRNLNRKTTYILDKDYEGIKFLEVYCWAKSKEQAKKIATDIRTRVLAERSDL